MAPDGSTTFYIDQYYEIKNGVSNKCIFAGDNRIAMVEDDGIGATETFYFHKDHLGSSTVMTKADATVMATTEYLPYGGERSHTGEDVTNYKFTDQEKDPESGLYNYDARLYDPMLGVFMTPDTIVPEPYNPQSLNRYAYVKNNPLRYVDPTGHEAGDAGDTGSTDTGTDSDDDDDSLDGCGGTMAGQNDTPDPCEDDSSIRRPITPRRKKISIAQRQREAVYGETRGLTPRSDIPDSQEQLQAARQGVAEVRGRNYNTHHETLKSNNPAEKAAWDLSVEAAKKAKESPSLPTDVNHFFIRQKDEGPQTPSWGEQGEVHKSYGPFNNPGGGDVPAGSDIYIDFYQGVPL